MPADAQREFAIEVVRQLRDAGHEALWAGGCVRDQLLARVPKDYDVATDARPEQIRQIFGRRRTLPIGASFGVMTVLGPKAAGQIEVATFRQDAAYSDGRHPDAVTFSNAKEDAQRRDFTINGLFYDPLRELVIDYVEGQQDLQAKVVRAIGDPDERIAEDKLRMLRAIRFAATFDFELETATFTALTANANGIRQVSVERITAELSRMWDHTNCPRATELLLDSGLLYAILPESRAYQQAEKRADLLLHLKRLREPSFSVALAILLYPLEDFSNLNRVEELCREWRVTNTQLKAVVSMLQHQNELVQAAMIPWPKLQRLLIHPNIDPMLQFAEATSANDRDREGVALCRERLSLPVDVLNPDPLISGNDLLEMGLPAGPRMKTILTAIRDAQLDQIVASREDAIAKARELM